MIANRSNRLELSRDSGRLMITVPWEEADDVQRRLRKVEVRTTLALDPARREARLVVWPGQDEMAVRAALGRRRD